MKNDTEPAKNKAGSSMVELIMVMTLLILFGVTIFTLIAAGGNAQQKIIDNKNSQVDARIALSYLNVKIRQNEEGSAIKVLPFPSTGKNALLFETRGEYEYDTWIFFDEGCIYEFLGFPGDAPSVDLSEKILDAKGLSIEYDSESNCITNTVDYFYNGAEKRMSAKVNLRVEGGAE